VSPVTQSSVWHVCTKLRVFAEAKPHKRHTRLSRINHGPRSNSGSDSLQTDASLLGCLTQWAVSWMRKSVPALHFEVSNSGCLAKPPYYTPNFPPCQGHFESFSTGGSSDAQSREACIVYSLLVSMSRATTEIFSTFFHLKHLTDLPILCYIRAIIRFVMP